MIGICAYDLDDFKKLDQESRKILFNHHNLHLTNNLYRNIFDDSTHQLTEHICMYLDMESQLSSFLPITNSLLRYLVEGLQQNQLCVYLSMNNLKKDHQKIILSQIPNLKKFQKENFMIIENSDDYYINAACDNLQPFEDLKKIIFEKAILDNKKDIRIVSDIQNFLFKNKHFDQCVALEEWWDQTIEDLNKRHGLNISLLCLYDSNNYDYSFTCHRDRINDNHSIVCDSDGIVHFNFAPYLESRKRKSEKAEGER